MFILQYKVQSNNIRHTPYIQILCATNSSLYFDTFLIQNMKILYSIFSFRVRVSDTRTLNHLLCSRVRESVSDFR